MEPATLSDLKDFMKELRDCIKEAVAEEFGNWKLDELSDPKSGVKELEATHDNVADALTPAEETVDIVPELAASSARAKPLNVDAPGAAAPTPSTCSTDGSGHDSGGNGSLAVSLLPQGMIRSFTAPLEASLTQPCRLFLVPGPDKMAPTRCSTICFNNDIDMLASVFRPDMTPSITPYGRPLRPEPWPSFSGKRTCTAHGGIVEPTPSTARALGRAVVPCPALQPLRPTLEVSPLRPTLEVSPTLSTRSGHGVPIGRRDASHYWGSIPRVGTALQERQKCCIIREPRQPWSPPWPRPMQVTVGSSEGKCFLSDSVQWQPWPPPSRDGIRYMRHLFRPRPWPWFKFHSDAGYPDEPYSVCCCELIPREGPFIYLSGTQLLSWRPSVLATSDPTQLSQEEAIHWEQVNYKGMQFSTWCLEQPLESGEHFIRCETAYGFYWERFALAVEIFREQLWLLQPKPTRTSRDWGSMLYFNQRPPGVYGLANSSTVSLCIPGILVCIPALFADDSVQHLVIPTSASIQIGGAQCKCLCTNSCLFCKWLVEVESSKNKKVIWQSSTEYFWRVCVMAALNMPIPITLTSNLCPTRGIIFPSYGSLLSSGSHDPIICLESTSATYAAVLPDQITPMYSACTVDVFGDPLSTASPLSCHQSIAKGAQIVSNLAQYPYACFVLDNPPLEFEAECLLTDLGMRPFSTVPYITLAIISDVLDPRNASPSAGFYSRHFATANPIYLLHVGDWIAHLLGSTSASGDHLEQLWDPGGLASYLCSTHAVTSPMHYLFEVWLACVLSICIQLRMEKPMASGELNQWMTINFLFGTLELDCRLDKLIVLLGFLPPFCCQSCKSTRSGKICVLGAYDDLGSFKVVKEGYWISASNQETFQGGRGFIVIAAVFAQGIVDHKCYLGFDHDNTDNTDTLGAFFNGVSIGHDFCAYLVEAYPDFGCHHDSNQVKEHQVQWDPGGSRWRRLGVKPNFKEGGVLGAPYNLHVYMGLPLQPTHGPGLATHHPSTARYKYVRRRQRAGIRVGSGRTARRPPLPPRLFFPNLLLAV